MKRNTNIHIHSPFHIRASGRLTIRLHTRHFTNTQPNMSGLEVVIVVGGALYVAKKIKEKKERKRLEQNAASQPGSTSLVGHGRAAEASRTPSRNSPRQQVPVEEEEALPLYKAPTLPLPPDGTTDMRWSNEIHLPTYDELPESKRGKETAMDRENHDENELSRVNSSLTSSSLSTPLGSAASAQISHLTPPMPDASPNGKSGKKHRFWRRSSSLRTSVEL